jgi:hypothetical protein
MYWVIVEIGSFNRCVASEKLFTLVTFAQDQRLGSGHFPESGNLNPDFFI